MTGTGENSLVVQTSLPVSTLVDLLATLAARFGVESARIEQDVRDAVVMIGLPAETWAEGALVAAMTEEGSPAGQALYAVYERGAASSSRRAPLAVVVPLPDRQRVEFQFPRGLQYDAFGRALIGTQAFLQGLPELRPYQRVIARYDATTGRWRAA